MVHVKIIRRISVTSREIYLPEEGHCPVIPDVFIFVLVALPVMGSGGM